jgi:hypothetical protein
MGKTLRRALRFVLFLLLAGAMMAAAETLDNTSANGDDAANPVAQMRNHRSWEYGPFLNWGSGVGYRSGYKFFWGGFELGKVLTPVVHMKFLSGQFELAGNIMPLWQAYTPQPHEQQYTCTTPAGQVITCILPTGGGTFRGVSITPVIFRWHFLSNSKRIQPWFQGAGGLIYTTHEFPPNVFSNPSQGIDGSTSVWNFSPQGGGGIHYFFRPKRSIDFGVNGMHISSASLGDRNPGVNGSVQVQVGYTWWK